jgi:hypothetical protein
VAYLHSGKNMLGWEYFLINRSSNEIGNFIQIIKTIIMEHIIELDELNKKSLQKIDEYLNTKDNLGKEHHAKLDDAKNKWQSSWTDMMDVLMYLETIEI